MEIESSVKKLVIVAILPVIGVPLFVIGRDKMNETFGAGDDAWVVTLYTIIIVLFFGLAPLGLLYSVLKAK